MKVVDLHTNRLRTAVVGLGKMGLVHASILNVLPDIQLVVLCEKSRIIRRFFGNVFKEMSIVDDVEKLSSYDLDAAFVTTPIPHHYSVVRTIYLNRIATNIFVEKTLAASHDEARELCSLAKHFGCTNMVGYLRRFYVTFARAKRLLEEGRIGELSSFKAYAYSSDFTDSETNAGSSASRGGVLNDLGCHAMDLALWFFGDLKVEPSRTRTFSQEKGTEVVHLELCQNSGLTGVCDVSWSMKDFRMAEVGISIEGSKGNIKVGDDCVELNLLDGRSARWYRHDLSDNVPFWLGLPEYFREDKYFVDRMIKNREAEPCFESAAKVDKMIDEVKISLKESY